MANDTFEYKILFGRDANVAHGVNWFSSANLTTPLGSNLRIILNDLGNQGWEVVAIGDLGLSARSDIILKRKT